MSNPLSPKLFTYMYYGNLPLAPSLGVVTAEEGVETEDVLALRLLLSTRLSRLKDHP